MIICASRRTDIPAFHPRWMMARLREGSCLVRNPVSRTSLLRVDLSRRNVDCIVFMTKDPRPMEPYLREIGAMGHMYVFQVTLTPYGRAIEPGVPFKADISDCCARISERIGRDRMVWRYDPVLYGKGMDAAYHERKFRMMCREASRWTDRCVFSFVDMYGRASKAGDLYRFPGGSFTLSAALTDAVHGAGYTYVDWNASVRDAEIPGASPADLLNAAKSTSAGRNKVVLLCHDGAGKRATADALKDIIAFYRAGGYKFCTVK